MSSIYTGQCLGNMELKNRWIMLAMHTGYGDDNGEISKRDIDFYRERAKGGAAAITLVGAVNQEGCSNRMHRLDSDIYNEGLQECADIMHREDCKAIMQLFHAGRNNNENSGNSMKPVCPSPVPSPIYRAVPREMSEEDIQRTIRDFAEAAARCKACGIDAVEISASAGYLLSQFFSPLVNLRTDQWGGSDEARMKFPTEVVKAVRQAVGSDYTVLIKISGGDMLGGYDIKYMIDFINQLPKGAVDGITVTGGWHEAPVPQISYHVEPGGFSYLAEEIKLATGIPVIACNRINSPEAAEKILNRGIVDFVGAARAFLADPYFGVKVRDDLPYNKCQGCNKGCIERVLKFKDVRCAFNPKAGREYLGKAQWRDDQVLVVGAGPVGLETAKLLLETGSHVTVITDEERPGGKLHIAAAPPQKEDMTAFCENALFEIESMGGQILTETPVTEELIDMMAPDHIYFAMGAEPRTITLPGEDTSNVDFVVADKILAGQLPPKGSRIIIIGGGTVGLETAEFLADKDNNYQLTVLEMGAKAGKDLGGLKWIVMGNLKKLGVKVITSAVVKGAVPNGVMVDINDENTEEYPCDVAVYAIGSVPRRAAGLEEYLDRKGIGYHIIGDGLKPRNIMEGLEEAFYQTL